MSLKLIEPQFNSELCALVCELSSLRTAGTNVESALLNDLKPLFFICESVASARIEGNRTTVAQYVKAVQERKPDLFSLDAYREITNIVEAMRWAEENVGAYKITEGFIRELHKRVVGELDACDGEGDLTPGEYRKEPVRILNSSHVPPDAFDVPAFMHEFVDWLDAPVAPQYELIKISLAHWRFAWIHPFRNGNGRVARLLMYALLVKIGFVRRGFALNPNAICCLRRQEYYERLELADRSFAASKGQTVATDPEKGLENWCVFLLRGLKEEFNSTLRLSNPDFVIKEIITPSVDSARYYDRLSTPEHKIALFVLRRETIRRSEIDAQFSADFSPDAIRRAWRSLREKNVVAPVRPKARQYRFAVSPYLYPFVIERMSEFKMISVPLR